MATHSSILAWEILRAEEPGGYSPCGCKKDTVEQLSNNQVGVSLHIVFLEVHIDVYFLISCFYRLNEVTQSCPTLYDPMDCSLPGSSLHGILQARALEWVAIALASLVAQRLKHLPAMRETQVRSLGLEDPSRRKGQPTPVLAWKIPWMEKPGRLQSMGS